MDDNRIPRVNPDFGLEKSDDEILLYTKMGTKAVYLNETAFTVWQLCKEELTLGEIIALLEQAYPEQASQIRSDVISALHLLEANNVIEWSDDK